MIVETEGVVGKNLCSGLRSVFGPLNSSVTFGKSCNLSKSHISCLYNVDNNSTGIIVLLGF